MVNTFISSKAVRFDLSRFGVAVLSVLAHAGIIGFAVIESGRPTAKYDPGSGLVEPERVNYVDTRVAALLHAGAQRVVIAHARKPARLIVPDMTRLTAVVNLAISALPQIPQEAFDAALPPHLGDARDFGAVDTGKLLEYGSTYALAHPGRDGAYSEDVVDRSAWPVRDNPQPRYPELLARQGVEQSFVVDFVVDSTGRVDAKTFAFPSTTHPMFLLAVKDALLHSRYSPAELAGIRVRQLVHQQFSFVIAR